MGQRHAGARQLGGHAVRLRPEAREDESRMDPALVTNCIYPGCDRPAAPPHPLGGPQPAFCDREDHNALTAHQERVRLEKEEGRG